MITGQLAAGFSSSTAKKNGWIFKYTSGSVYDGTFISLPSDSAHVYLVTRNLEIRKIKASTGTYVDTFQYSLSASLHDVVSDSSSNIYITASSGNNIYVIKINSSMQVVWQKTMANTQITYAEGAIRVDGSGNVYVTNYDKTGTYYFSVLTKLDSSGNVLWQRQLSNASSETSLQPLALDSSSNIYVAGYYYSGSTAGAVVMKFDTNGNHQWTTGIDNTSVWDAFLNEVQVDSSGNIYALGFSDNQGRRSFIAKLTSSGSVSWQKTIGGAAFEWVGPGQIVIDGSTLYLNMFGPTVDSNNVISLVAFDLSGTKQYERQLRIHGQNLYSQKVSVIGSSVYFSGYGPYGFAFKAPKDGSKTGTYNSFGQVVSYIPSATQLVEQSTTYSVSSGGVGVSSTSRAISSLAGSISSQPSLTVSSVRRF